MHVGTLLGGRYRIERELGAGGMARVYQAHDTAIDRFVAVKVLREQFEDDPVFRERFAREARAAGRLSHPNIVAVYDVGRENGSSYIVMQLVNGKTLRDLLNEHGRLPVSKVAEIGSQIANALGFAHAQGVIHRDVKPENILVTQSSEKTGQGRGKLWAYLADFGIARGLEEAALTSSNDVFGTVPYLSPERGSGQPATPSSDIYALGIVLYECLAGRRPFQGESPVAIAMAHATQPVPSIRAINPAVPASIERIILRALAKRPADRFSSAPALGQALAGQLNGSQDGTAAVPPVAIQTTRYEPYVEQPESTGRPSWMWGIVGFAGALTVLILGGAAAFAASTGQFRGLAPPVSTAPALAATATAQPAASPTATPIPVVKVPKVEGMEVAAGKKALTDAGFQVKDGTAEFSASVAASRIIRTSPAGDANAPKGSTVEVIASKGPELVAVPTVTGLRSADAKSRLEALGLKTAEVHERNTRTDRDIVFQQDPAAGAQVAKGSTVTYKISEGNRTQVPNVVGLPLEDAKKAIEKADLRNDPYPNQQGPEQVPATELQKFCVGCVLSTSPGAGEWVDQNTEIKIAIRRQ